MKVSLSILSAIMIFQSSSVFAMASKPLPSLDTVAKVDLNSYAGKWYEIARIPHFYESGCVGATAEYALRPDGKVDVRNTCRLSTCDGKVKEASGIARVVNDAMDPSTGATATNAKLKVSFAPPFEGDYWVLELGILYSYSVVGTPDRKSFWILSRTPRLPDFLVQDILTRFEAKGFKFDNLTRTLACE